MENKKIGLFLQNLRKEKNMTQLELATQFNFTHQTVSKWENGDSLPDISTLSALAKFYGITIEEILQGESNTPIDTKVNEELDTAQKWMIARVVCSGMIFISFFLNYLSESVKLSEYMNPINNYDPFNIGDTVVDYNYKGFNLIFKAIKLTLFTGGTWLIFLSTLTLMTIFGLIVYSIFKKQGLFSFIKEGTYLVVKKITEIVLLVGFTIILFGAIFNKSVQVNIGYMIGFIFAIGLIMINYFEKKLNYN